MAVPISTESDAKVRRAAKIVVVAFILSGALLGWAVSTLWSKADQAWQKSRCPSDAFYAGGLGGVLSPFAVGIFTFFFLGWLVLRLVSQNEGTKKAYAVWSPHTALSSSTKFMGFVSIIILLAVIGFCSVDFSNSYCLSPNGIQTYRGFGTVTRIYNWSQVKRVKTICWVGKRGNHTFHLDIVTSEGFRLQLPEYDLFPPVSESSVKYFPGVKMALADKDFDFDKSAIQPSCIDLGPLVERT